MGLLERRRQNRVLCAGLVEVRWSDEGGYPCEAMANLDDVSTEGACLMLDQSIPVGTRIAVGPPVTQVEAIVRHCSHSALGWVTGAQFVLGKTPGIRACNPSHCVDPRTLHAPSQTGQAGRLSPEVRGTISCLTLFEAISNREE